MDLDFYNYLKNIDNCFNNQYFYRDVSAKLHSEDYHQSIIYKNIINALDRFTIKILSKNNIIVTIPIKKTNYIYTTNFTNIENVYNYIDLHITNYFR